MWYIVVFQPFKCGNAHFQPQIWSIWPIFPNDSESLPKVCYINWKNSEILSKLRNSESAGGSAPYCVALCQLSSVTMPRCGIAFPFPVLGTSYHSSVCSMNWYYHHMKYTLQTPRSFSITDVGSISLQISNCFETFQKFLKSSENMQTVWKPSRKY